MSLFCCTQSKIVGRMFVTKQILGPIDYHSIFFLLLWSVEPQICLVTNILPTILLCVKQNKDISTGLEQLEGK